MKAIRYTRFGQPDVLHLAEIDKPVPASNQVLIKVHASTVNSGDCKLRSFKDIPWTIAIPSRFVFGFRTPKKPILGGDFAGEVEAVGDQVTKWKPGDKVFGFTGMCFGAYAQYLCVSADGAIAPMPENQSYQEMAAIPFGVLTGMHFLKAGKIAAGENVMIYGASGAVGVAAIQLAKHFGATVTGVCSTKHVQLVRALGADHVIDYTQQDYLQSQTKYDMVFDTVGKTTFSKCKRILNPNGRYLQTVFAIRHLLLMLCVNLTSSRKIICSISPDNADDLLYVKKLVEDGQYNPVIDRTYPLEQTAQAHRYVDEGHKTGSVVLTVDH